MTNEIIFSILEIFTIFAIGFLAKRFNYLNEDELNRFSKFIVDILFPFLIFTTISQHFTFEKLRFIWPLPLVGFGMIAIGAICGIFLKKAISNQKPDLQKTFHHFCAVNNFGFLPIIIINNLWGQEMVANLFLLNAGSNLAYWTIGVGLLGESNLKSKLKKLITPSFIAVIIAIIFAFTGLQPKIPHFAWSAFTTVGNASVPCMLIIVGASLYPLPKISKKFELSYLLACRLVFIPLIYIVLIYFIPFDIETRKLSLILSLMPAALTSAVLTRIYGGDTEFAVQAVIFSTILSIITIPAWIYLLINFYPTTQPLF